MMTLPETALAFCLEVLNWPHAKTGLREQPFIAKSGSELFGEENYLWYSNLKAVMEYARAWQQKNGLFMAMYFYPTIDAVMVTVFDDNLKVEVEEADECHALMSACVEAARKLREAV